MMEKEVEPSGHQALRQRRVAKRKRFLYQHMYQSGLNVDVAKDVTAFYNDIVPFVNLFSSDFACFY